MSISADMQNREKELLANIVCEDEQILTFNHTDNPYVVYHFVAPADEDVNKLDISACIEDTLHRLLDAGATDKELEYIMGVVKMPSFWEDLDNVVYIDLDYIIPGMLLGVWDDQNLISA